MIKEVWTTEMEEESDSKNAADVPSHFKRYTIQDRKIIVVQQPIRSLQKPGESYDGPEDAKKINLAEEGEDPKPAYIATDLDLEEEELLSSYVERVQGCVCMVL